MFRSFLTIIRVRCYIVQSLNDVSMHDSKNYRFMTLVLIDLCWRSREQKTSESVKVEYARGHE